jgi:hypothetical protein
MIRRTLLAAACLSFPAAAMAHLCNDVFVQARDNLAVKVDVRDGQLRIGEKASFRVYLLNTMDREIARIALQVRTNDKFNAQVKPSPDWKTYPKLYSSSPQRIRGRKGKKEYFQVTLTRKPGVPDGRYKIDLHLYNPRNRRQVFKTVDLGQAAGILEVPAAAKIEVDGKLGAEEWGKSLLCTGFSCTQRDPKRRRRKYYVNVPAPDQGRFRVAADRDNVYLALAFAGGAPKSDVIDFYAAKDLEASPVKVSIDRVAGTASCPAGGGLECKVSADRSAVEVRIPRKLLGVAGAGSFLANFVRTSGRDKGETVSFWRGNAWSVTDPVQFARFRLAD